jgi:hypothetical protein
LRQITFVDQGGRATGAPGGDADQHRRYAGATPTNRPRDTAFGLADQPLGVDPGGRRGAPRQREGLRVGHVAVLLERQARPRARRDADRPLRVHRGDAHRHRQVRIDAERARRGAAATQFGLGGEDRVKIVPRLADGAKGGDQGGAPGAIVQVGAAPVRSEPLRPILESAHRAHREPALGLGGAQARVEEEGIRVHLARVFPRFGPLRPDDGAEAVLEVDARADQVGRRSRSRGVPSAESEESTRDTDDAGRVHVRRTSGEGPSGDVNVEVSSRVLAQGADSAKRPSDRGTNAASRPGGPNAATRGGRRANARACGAHGHSLVSVIIVCQTSSTVGARRDHRDRPRAREM